MKKVEIFNSIAEFMNVVNSRPENEFFKDKRLASINGDKKFTDTENYAEADKLFSEGWLNGKKYLKTMAAGKKEFAPTPAYQRKRVQAGGRLHVGALIAQADAVWVRRQKTLKDNYNPVINIFYDIATFGGTEATAKAEASGKVFSAIRKLEESGYHVELYIGDCSTSDGDSVGCLIRLKSSNEKLSETKMLYPIIHASFARRHCFRWLETATFLPHGGWVGGYGGVITNTQKLKELVNTQGKKFHAVLNAQELIWRGYTAEQIEDSIKAQRAEAVK